MSGLFPAVRAAERPRFLFLFWLAVVLLAGLAVGLTAAESLLLSRLGVGALPKAILAASLLTVGGSAAYSAFVGGLRHEDYLLRLLALGVGILATSGVLVQAGVEWVFLFLFCFYSLACSVLTTHYFSLASACFDTLSSKRLFPLLGVGATLGELLGGLTATAFARLFAAEALLWVWLGLTAAGALLILGHRTRLRGWNPQPAAPARGSLLDGLRYLRASALGRSLTAAVVSMMLVMSLIQYLYAGVFVKSFPDAADLAAFLGAFLAGTNLLELWIGSQVTPRLIARLGVATANLIHPALCVLSLLALGLHYSLVPAMLAWMSRGMFQDCFATPVRALVFNAFPERFRGRARGFLEGIVAASARAAIGVALVAAQGVPPRLLTWVGVLLALGYGLAALKVRAEYLDTLVEGLRQGRLRLDVEPRRLVGLWREWLSGPSPPVAAAGPMARALVRSGQAGVVDEGLGHPRAAVRALCLAALQEAPPPGRPVSRLQTLARGPDPEERLLAARVLASCGASLADLLEDPDPRVRAVAAAAGGDRDRLSELLEGGEPAVLVEAAGWLPPDLSLEMLEHRDARVHTAALERLAQLGTVPVSPPGGTEGGRPPVSPPRGDGRGGSPVARVARELSHPDPQVRMAAGRVLAAVPDPLARELLARSLADPAPAVRQQTVRLLGGLRDQGVEAARPFLSSGQERAVEAALSAIGAAETPRSRLLLLGELRHQVREAWFAVAAGPLLEAEPGRWVFLRAAFEDAARRNRRLAFHILELLEGAEVVGSLRGTLRFSAASARADALEVLSNLGDREAASLLVLLLDETPLEERLETLGSLVPRDRDQLLAQAASSPDRWVRLGWLACSRPDGPVRWEALDRLLALRAVDLFEALSLEELESVGEEVVEERFGPRTLPAQGGKLCLIQEGTVQLLQGDREVERLGPGDWFGALSVLDGKPPSATARALGPVRLLSLEREPFLRVVRLNPEVCFRLFRRLTRQLHRTETEIQRLSTSAGDLAVGPAKPALP